MKGITHFAAGLAAAALVPGAMELAQHGSLVLMVGGIGGILPDTVDFKWSRFVEDYPFEVDPDPHNPDPQAIADTLAAALDAAFEADGAPIGLMIHTTRLGADAWRQLTVTFDSENQEVRVKVGSVVTLSGLAIADTDPGLPVATAKTRHPFAASYLDTLRVNIFSGPSWELRKQKDGLTHLEFIAWHRRGTHSLFFAFCLFLLGWLLFGEKIYGVAAAVGVLAHIAEDQLGFMGCSVLWPYNITRWKGLAIWHSGDAMANFSSIWLCLALVAWRMHQFNPTHPLGAETTALSFAFWWSVLPLGLLWLCRAVFFPPVEHRRLTLSREEEGLDGEGTDGQWLQDLREQDVLNELGGAEGAP
jgi:membrane-bound metal-dependent hydrolase YbcI (DUF457 family)